VRPPVSCVRAHDYAAAAPRARRTLPVAWNLFREVDGEQLSARRVSFRHPLAVCRYHENEPGGRRALPVHESQSAATELTEHCRVFLTWIVEHISVAVMLNDDGVRFVVVVDRVLALPRTRIPCGDALRQY
jgi:hypothetical protein